jgi:hypothetical protein
MDTTELVNKKKNLAFFSSDMPHLTSNIWDRGVPKTRRDECRRNHTHGVEVRNLGQDHFLAGEQGLFATNKFSRFDLVGEYTGRIVNSEVVGKLSLELFSLEVTNCHL